MKKIKITLSVMMLMIGTTGMAFAAAQSATGPTALTVGATSTASITPSSNVMITYNGIVQSYGISSQHLNGTRIFGSGSGIASLYYKTKTAGTNTAEDPATTFAAGAGWTAQ